MKNRLPFHHALFLSAFMLTVCSSPNEELTKEKLKFTFSLQDVDATNGRSQQLSIPKDAVLLLTLETTDGEPVFTQEPIQIMTFGNSYITDPIELFPGYYRILDFMVINEDNEVLYAAPKHGSRFAQAVDRPIPYNIFIGKNSVTNFEIEVISTHMSEPEDFGYISFHLKAGTAFQISVLTFENDEYKFIDAKAHLIKEEKDTLHSYVLYPKVNVAFFGGDQDATYTLVVEKPGYETHTSDFRFSILGNEPIKVVLNKIVNDAATLQQFHVGDRRYSLYYNVRGEVDSILISEGEGINYKYIVTYTDNKIDSVSTIDGSELVSTHDDFHYDNEGRITGFKYYFPGTDHFIQNTIGYDATGRIVSINDQDFVYEGDNIVQGFGASYSYDEGLNPFHRVKNLFAIVVEESFLWEYVLSENNSVTRTNDGTTIHYKNIYDSDGRLIRKEVTGGVNSDAFSFVY